MKNFKYVSRDKRESSLIPYAYEKKKKYVPCRFKERGFQSMKKDRK